VTDPVVTDPVVTDTVVTDAVATDPVVTDPVVADPVVTELVVQEAIDSDACAACGVTRVAGNRFCEGCGVAFPVVTESIKNPVAGSCSTCGGTEIDADGYCQTCGAKQPSARDHFETDNGSVAGVCDRGIRHAVNQDAMAIWSAPAGLQHVVVVCDGVSSSAASDVASLAAAQAAVEVLVSGVGAGWDAVPVAMVDAAGRAQGAVLATPFVRTPDLDAPSCTFVAAVVDGARVHVGWLGDSRAYWLGERDKRQLSVDDSWATAMVESGTMRVEDAEADNRAHQITRWLGADATDVVPRTTEFVVDEPGLLLLCSDGLWNYASTPASIADLVAELGQSSAEPRTMLAIAKHLCAFANSSGGHDNITVVVCELRP
jgi:serine/threonine protein phosphatase PrpC